MTALPVDDREKVRGHILEASEPIAPFWPMRTMVAQNPIHGLKFAFLDEVQLSQKPDVDYLE